jgi:hypothetical protein
VVVGPPGWKVAIFPLGSLCSSNLGMVGGVVCELVLGSLYFRIIAPERLRLRQLRQAAQKIASVSLSIVNRDILDPEDKEFAYIIMPQSPSFKSMSSNVQETSTVKTSIKWANIDRLCGPRLP